VGIFRRRPEPEHDPGVVYVFEKGADYEPYYAAVCRCGWFAEPVKVLRYPDPQVEERMAAAARAHDSNASTHVAFPLDQP
jgi:hypothetical protein